MTIQDLQNYKSTSGLERETMHIILNNIEEEYEESFFEDLMSHGCVSGMVSGLIYYAETVKFFDDNRVEIGKMLSDTLIECGLKCASELFGDKFDSDDMLCIETTNQNLLAWFAFEETARAIASNLGMEL
ncbi:hypothetical protein [Sulfuricurvum sp.]|uniref:DUF7222 domain-containing protein n=1 Tax=Sulfuricurvum sp. TaxID=2025608 RepID=UPI0026231845|nr:hypothetical protein [Sulfuricurvum sp.]MDD4950501.1 hypothetical protein [Sulfuricurvum sp.]